MVKIKQQLVSNSVINKRSYGGGNPCDYIIIHETANTTKGANAEMHARLQSNLNPRTASWHYQVDDKEIVQSFKDNVKCWHAGGDKLMNLKSLSIEICVNSDGNFDKAIKNAVKLTKHLMKKHGIDIDHIKTHNWATGKDCPRFLRSGAKGTTIDDLYNMIEGKKKKEDKPKKDTNNKKPSKKEYTGNSIVDYLKFHKKNTSFSSRKKLANKHGIKNYKGSASQNLELLKLLRNGEKSSAKKEENKKANKKYSSNYNGNSIVEFLQSVGISSGFSNRKKLAKKYGVKGKYRGTASQNLELLKLMQGESSKGGLKQYSVNYTGNSIVDFLNIIGTDDSFSNREKLAKKYGVSNYKGTAKQNLELLSKMRK